MGAYFDELKRSMNMLAADERVLFLGQAVAHPGTAMSNTLLDVPKHQLLELPVNEDLQMGMTNGLAVAGQIPEAPEQAELTIHTVQAEPEQHAQRIVDYLRERGYLG